MFKGTRTKLVAKLEGPKVARSDNCNFLIKMYIKTKMHSIYYQYKNIKITDDYQTSRDNYQTRQVAVNKLQVTYEMKLIKCGKGVAAY